MSDSEAAEAEVRWIPLESNPPVMTKYMHKLGMSKDWAFSDVLGLDEELLLMVPQPVAALILLFPSDDKYRDYAKEEQEKIDKEGQVVSDKLYFMKQTIRNACGTVGVLHAALNCIDSITLDKTLAAFLEETKDLSPAERGKKLETNQEIREAHGASAQEGQTEAPSAEESVCPHFIALVEKDNNIYELDGNKKYPINHGPVEDGFLKSAAKVCKKFMERNPEELRFTVMALAQDN